MYFEDNGMITLQISIVIISTSESKLQANTCLYENHKEKT